MKLIKAFYICMSRLYLLTPPPLPSGLFIGFICSTNDWSFSSSPPYAYTQQVHCEWLNAIEPCLRLYFSSYCHPSSWSQDEKKSDHSSLTCSDRFQHGDVRLYLSRSNSIRVRSTGFFQMSTRRLRAINERIVSNLKRNTIDAADWSLPLSLFF